MTPLRHRRWYRFDLMQRRKPFCGLRVLFYIRRSVEMIGWDYRLRAQFKRMPKLHLSLRGQLHDRRKPKWVPRDPRLMEKL